MFKSDMQMARRNPTSILTSLSSIAWKIGHPDLRVQQSLELTKQWCSVRIVSEKDPARMCLFVDLPRSSDES